ncbi:hypothetical protein EFK50_16415 [Nocardioides marmoriginsengisoli]|uniref:DUF916 domain-containing protein n=1 Tax=Nocardioides marmoriginsengisoli TaxID=661483 RepID=A0A3N0CIJ9_9ACTN|nr:DUF916 domain-containing protein [Nocardioides marmoriginsengisoli]RNL63272.1 hypothetical protein EFK50_16415 [Nocardioides marmoriginsengisoli]
MRRHRAAPRLTSALAVLAAGLLAGSLLALPTAAHAADDPSGPDTKAKNSATVGIRTANAKGGDDRGVFDYEVLPRGVVQDWIAISNFRYQPITIRLLAKDASSTPNAGFDIQASADEAEDVGSWISLKKNKLTLPARTEVVVPFQLGVPHDATPGDHSGAIVVSLLAKEPKPDGGSIVVDHRVGMRIHLRVPGDLKPALKVEDLKVDWNGAGSPLGRGDATVTYTVRNTGNVRMNASGGIELTRILGLPGVDATAPPVEDLLPGGVAQYRSVVKNVFGTGPMKAEIALHGVPVDAALKEKAIDVTTTEGFAAWPWLLIAIVVAVLLLAGGGGYYERRRRQARAAEQAGLLAAEERDRASAKHRMLVRGALLAGVLGALLSPGLGVPATAANGDEWKATISKKQGIALEPFDIETSGGCPLPATSMIGYGYGRGFPKEGAIVVSNTDGAVTNETGFTAALGDSMKNLMAAQPDPRGLAGEYRFVIRCIKAEFPDKSYGEYVAAIKFDKPDHWVALPPLTNKKGPVVQIPTTGPNGEPKTKNQPGGGTAGPDGNPSDDAQAQGSAADRAGDLLGTDAPAATDDGPSWVLMAAGIVVLIGSLALAFGRRIPGPWRRS